MRLRGLIAVPVLLSAVLPHAAAEAPALSSNLPALRTFIQQNCIDCHNGKEPSGDFAFDVAGANNIGDRAADWEKVVRKLRSRQMPPPDAPRPTEQAYNQTLSVLEAALDQHAAAHPDPGRTDTFRRLTRTEYQNAIRDLLDLEVDVRGWLPADESSHGFDNVTVGDLSPTLLDRYITAGQKISRLAVGGSGGRTPGGETIRIRPDLTQEEHVEGLPIGTRGGASIPFIFPQDGEYEVQVRLARDRNENIEGLRGTHELEILLDRQRADLLTVQPAPNGQDPNNADEHLKTRIQVTAGPHQLGVTFLKNPSSLLETKRQPLNAHFNMHRHPRISPAVYQVSITGPFSPGGKGDTPSRRRIFITRPADASQEEVAAKQILQTLLRRAYRRPVTDSDLEKPLAFYREGRIADDFDSGIESALSSILVSPRFLFRIEDDPEGIAPKQPYLIGDFELASRLSFFLWSSLPDDELLEAAAQGSLQNTAGIERQVRRMLKDPRVKSLTTNFAGQWLYLRNLESITPDLRLFPDFDDNLRQAFRQETELCFERLVREDRSVLDLLKSDSTFLNERLAKHYDIPHIYGSRFRQVACDEDTHRGGLLRQGSILTVTSYATRTSPVIRGNWILKNILGAPASPPPANVPALKDQTVDASLSVRARLAEHRANAACANCHQLMDPVGFSLENFDAVGRWRIAEDGIPVDSSGGLPDGSTADGVAGLENALLARPELFVGTLAEKLLTFGVGRGIEPSDAPSIRNVVRQARQNEYRFSSLIVGIATSTPFRMRRSE